METGDSFELYGGNPISEGVIFMMSEEKTTVKRPHHIILEERKNLSVSGVTEVASFDEEVVVLFTQTSELTIRGKNLHISRTNVETGELIMDGEIDEISYSAPSLKKKHPGAGTVFGKFFG